MNQATAQPAVQRRGNFLASTTRTRVMLQDVNFTNPGDQKSQDLFATGFVSYLNIQVYGTLTTGTGATGTWDTNFFPFNLLAKLRLASNAGFEFYNTDGYRNLLVQKYHRIGFDPGVPISPLSFNSGTQGARVAITQAPSGSVSASTAYKILVNYLIPVVSHPDLRAGLLPLQNNATRVTNYMTLGQWSDWGVTAAGTGATINLTARTRMEFFSMPSDPTAMPDLSFIHRIIQDTQAWTATGDQTYRVPVNGVILRAWASFKNGTAPAVWFGTANDPTTQQFNNISVRYAASQQPEVYDFKHMLYDHRLNYNMDLPNGTLMFDFATGGGSPEMGVSARDAYNTRRLTEFAFIVNTAISPAGNSTLDVTRQELQPRSS